jgi:DNA-binding MarR family transcriptional regulator
MKKSRKEGTNPLSIKNIDRTIHEPARFFIMAHLAVVDSMDFLFLMNQTQLTQGNLSAHLSKLESADYIRIKKEFVNKKPRTLLRITEKGKAAFRAYRERMKELLEPFPNESN